MKSLIIKNSQYKYLENDYKKWMLLSGNAKNTAESYSIHLHEFLHWLEQSKIQDIQNITSFEIEQFLYYIKHRRNQRYGGLLSKHSILKIHKSLISFSKYLRLHNIIDLKVKALEQDENDLDKTILTLSEIERLYEATYEIGRNNSLYIGQRDRAILGILYGCGLRINECRHVNNEDVDLKNRVVEVLRGKGGKLRIVPIVGRALEDLELYKNEGRYWFLDSHKQKAYYNEPIRKDSSAFFISQHGSRLVCGYYKRLKILKDRTGIKKQITPHILRHSIATHLLANGVEIQFIQEFLGHSSLESTQIYTHILHNNESIQSLVNKE